jgi:hypothetical protein
MNPYENIGVGKWLLCLNGMLERSESMEREQSRHFSTAMLYIIKHLPRDLSIEMAHSMGEKE